MYFAATTTEDGYFEQKVSLAAGLPPFILLRAVLQRDGKFKAVIRCAQSGKSLFESQASFSSPNRTLIYVLDHLVDQLSRGNWEGPGHDD